MSKPTLQLLKNAMPIDQLVYDMVRDHLIQMDEKYKAKDLQNNVTERTDLLVVSARKKRKRKLCEEMFPSEFGACAETAAACPPKLLVGSSDAPTAEDSLQTLQQLMEKMVHRWYPADKDPLILKHRVEEMASAFEKVRQQ